MLTHYARPSIEMKGGTTFHFIDASPVEALAAAREAEGLEERFDIEAVSSPSGVTHLTFTRR
ncbi:MAG: hypothetical protein WAK83_29845 [Trebonia sp.]|uniref:hypothetical protein n=1 Tax=Trebonia sp. TaxID=2767075 RepID=UPI003BB101DF